MHKASSKQLVEKHMLNKLQNVYNEILQQAENCYLGSFCGKSTDDISGNSNVRNSKHKHHK